MVVAALDLAQNGNVQDAYLIAVEQQARERLERLSALKKIKPVDMSKLSQQVTELTRISLVYKASSSSKVDFLPANTNRVYEPGRR